MCYTSATSLLLTIEYPYVKGKSVVHHIEMQICIMGILPLHCYLFPKCYKGVKTKKENLTPVYKKVSKIL
jgi:hypothetical protein